MSKFRTAGSSIELDPDWIAKMSPKLAGQPVGLYGRISGVKSLDGSSLESQIAVNRRFALTCGARIVIERTEVITGVSITSRSEFNLLLNLAEKGEIHFIIVDVRDRLGRGDAIAVLEFLARQVGAEIVYATQPADLDTYEGAALDATETLVSRIERLNIRRRTNRGRREWASEGRIFTGRFWPYGYRVKMARDDKGRLIERTLVIYEPEARIIRKIFHWFVYDDLTTYAIAARLHKERIPVPEGHANNRKRTVNQWYSSTVERMIQNETYAGVWHYAKRELKRYEVGDKIRHKYIRHPSDHQIAIKVPAIIDRGFWETAQRVLAKHARGGRNPKYHYLLTGILRCIKSHVNMHGHTAVHKNGQYGYYVCPHRGPNLRMDKSTRCDVHRLRQQNVEDWVWNTIMKLAEQPEQIETEMAKRREEAEREQHLSLQAIAGLQKEIERYETQKTDLLDVYLNHGKVGKLITREDYETKAAQIADEIERLKAQLIEMQQRNGPDVPNKEQADEAIRLLKAVRVAAQEATFAEKRTILRLLDVHVLYNGEMLELSGGVPVQSVDLEKLLKGDLTGGNSSLLPQSGPSDGSRVGEEGNSTFEDQKRSMDCMPS